MPKEHRSFKDRLLVSLAPRVGAIIIRLLGASLRIRFVHPERETQIKSAGKQLIYAFWHSWILTGCYARRNRKITTLISQHRDGELIARTAVRLGYQVSRGSSSRGGAGGLKGLCDAAEAGQDLSINPDGPKGPAKQAHPGVIMLASLTGLPILPSAMAFSRAWRLNSWDRFVIPKPFSRVVIVFASPIEVPRDLTEDMLLEYRETLRQSLLDAEVEAEKALDEEKKK